MTDRPTIEFPCADYPIKVIADSGADLAPQVADIVRQHDEFFREETIQLVASRKGNYTSVRLAIRATGEPQLAALHRELMDHPLVKLVL